MRDFKKCKEVATKFMNGEISPLEFEAWSKENCETCGCYIRFIGQKEKRCLFGSVKKSK